MPSTHQPYAIAIVGASIAGLCAALLQHRLGNRVTIFERSNKEFQSRGAGVVLPIALFNQCIEQDLFDKTIPHHLLSSRTFHKKDMSATGEKIWQQSFDVVSLNWSVIYSNLRKRLPDNLFHYGEEITDLQIFKDGCRIKSTKTNQNFDLLIAADGIDSFIRKQVYPDIKPEYAGYIGWRGVVTNTALTAEELFGKNVPYSVFPGGHIILYCIPNADNQLAINWVLYTSKAESQLTNFFVDKNGNQHTVSLPPGSLHSGHISELHKLAKEKLPPLIANVILETKNPFVQSVYDSNIPSYVFNNICFVGDAATVLRPHTASGVVKGLMDGMSFAQTFIQNDSLSLDNILKIWNEAKSQTAKKQVTLSKAMGEALVTNQPDWEQMNFEKMSQWWDSLMAGKQWYATPTCTYKPSTL